MTKSNVGGFTLIELMITVVILSILAAIAYPSYTNYVTVARRSEATINLTQIAAQEEKFLTNCGTYTLNFNGNISNANTALRCTGLGYGPTAGSFTTVNGYYTIRIAAGPTGIAAGYILTATPDLTQATRDAGKCDQISIDSTGLKTAVGTDGASCWKH
jgi:type IV pilus assembly protein PilE